MALTRDSIVNALADERAINLKGAPFDVVDARWEDSFILLSVKPAKSRNKLPLDDGLEGARIRWGSELELGGVIKFVDADNERIVVEPVEGGPPKSGATVWVYQNDFLGPLIDLWTGPMASKAAKRLKQSKEEVEPLEPVAALPPLFAELRERQAEALQNTAYRCSIMIGPPGTGKSFTVGAMVAHTLLADPTSRILVVGPTNVAVDTAILSVDDWLHRIDRPDLARRIKRIGAHFDPRKYADRPHLLAKEVAEKVNAYLLLEAAEPPKSKIAQYAKWKDQMAAARASLGADIETTTASARVVAVTVATAIRWQAVLASRPFSFVLCDESSQVVGPAALMIAAMADRVIFAGDPQQLSPIARADSKPTRQVLSRTAFDLFRHVRTASLNEQSRMTQAICSAVGATFYAGDLRVCKKANRDSEWKKARSPFFVNGREVPRVCFDRVAEPATYSQKYGGFIRFTSAERVCKALDALAGSYVDPKDVVVLTPYRAQVALIRSMIRRSHPEVSVSTVHRAQGSERTLVIFDPVDASSRFFEGSEGDRLVNVAISRAKAHVVIPFHENDLQKPALKTVHAIASKLWQTSGKYMKPFTFE